MTESLLHDSDTPNLAQEATDIARHLATGCITMYVVQLKTKKGKGFNFNALSKSISRGTSKSYCKRQNQHHLNYGGVWSDLRACAFCLDNDWNAHIIFMAGL